MSNDPDFIQYVCYQIDSACDVTHRNMFGGTTLYSKGKVVALICDNQLFVKLTEAGRAHIGAATEAPAYEGSKNFFLIGDEIDDTEWLTALITVTEQELPKSKPRKKKKKNSRQ
ncbi:MAG: TfoX/Sxy family protein [Gammaproteobacteria bacterium]|nr:TfoX/Sxy family protein [Gammaproteobacteria bacterium]NNL49474.1 TfoX/Sxy family protein [Woeseiaceae bacterium]